MKFLPLTFLLFLFLYASPQKQLKEHPAKSGESWMELDPISLIDDPPGGTISLHALTKNDGKLVLLTLISRGNVHSWLMNDSHVILQEYQIERPERGAVIQGGFMLEHKAVLFLGKENADELFTLDFSFDSSVVVPGKTVLDLHKERLIDGVDCGDRFVYLSVQKNNPVINLYEFDESGNYQAKQYDFGTDSTSKAFEGADLYHALVPSGGDRAVFVDTRIEQPASKLKSQRKIYYRNDSIFVVIDKELNSSQILLFDVKHQTHAYRFLTRENTLCPETATASFNSFLLGNNLYYLEACRAGFNLSVFNLYSEYLLKKYSALRSGTIDFANSPVLQRGNAFSSKSERVLEKTSTLLNRMLSGNALVAAKEGQGGEIEVVVGAYIVKSGGGGGMMMGGGGGMMVPMYGVGYGMSSWNQTARFISVIDAKTLEKINRNVSVTLGERINAYSESKKIPEEAETYFRIGADYYFACYDKRSKSVNLIKL